MLTVTDSASNTATSNTILIYVTASQQGTLLYITNSSSMIDFNGNGTIDSADVNEVMAYYGETVNSENEKYDIDKDGNITIYDVNAVSRNVGYVSTDIYLNGTKVATIILKNETIYIGSFSEGNYTLRIVLITGEEATLTLNLQGSEHTFSTLFSNPWLRTTTLLFGLSLTGEQALFLRATILSMIIFILLLAVVLYMKQKRK